MTRETYIPDVHGDEWMARQRREHERHEGLPVYPGTGHMRPPFQRTVPVITSAMLAEQRATWRHPYDGCAQCEREHDHMACPRCLRWRLDAVQRYREQGVL